jgi:hypothetical protein
MSGQPRRDELTDGVNKVLRILQSLPDGESVTHAELCGRTGLSGRLAFAAISWLDGRVVLLGGAPGGGYRVARRKGEGARRSAALLSQAREMLGRRRNALEDTLP